MTPNAVQLVGAVFAMVLLTFAVAVRMLYARVSEMRKKRIHPQLVSTSVQMAARLEHTQAADNFRNLFEVPVLFYALAAVALATHQVTSGLLVAAWAFVVLRVLHSAIHCTYNKVMHRLAAFAASFAVLVAAWVSLWLSLQRAAAG